MKVSKKAEKNVNLHIKTVPDGAHHITKFCAENGDVLAC
jgi:hypothetical protein